MVAVFANNYEQHNNYQPREAFKFMRTMRDLSGNEFSAVILQHDWAFKRDGSEDKLKKNILGILQFRQPELFKNT
jgi:hypothetical protein